MKKVTGLDQVIIVLYIIVLVSLNLNLSGLQDDPSNTVSKQTLIYTANALLLGATVFSMVAVRVISNKTIIIEAD